MIGFIEECGGKKGKKQKQIRPNEGINVLPTECNLNNKEKMNDSSYCQAEGIKEFLNNYKIQNCHSQKSLLNWWRKYPVDS